MNCKNVTLSNIQEQSLRELICIVIENFDNISENLFADGLLEEIANKYIPKDPESLLRIAIDNIDEIADREPDFNANTPLACIANNIEYYVVCDLSDWWERFVKEYKKMITYTDINNYQPTPAPSDHPHCWDLVIEDMKARDEFGEKKYNTHLQPFNNRDSLVDAYQELLDLVVYLRQKIYEEENMRANRVDENQKEIVEELVHAGRKVQHLNAVKDGCPDILVSSHCANCRVGFDVLMEIKTKSGKLIATEEKWISEWLSNVFVVRDIYEALEASTYCPHCYEHKDEQKI